MAALLELKENFKRFYNKYDTYLVPALKFIVALVSFFMLNASIGYMEKLNNPVIAVLICYLCISASRFYYSYVIFIYAGTSIYNISRICTYSIVCGTSYVPFILQIYTKVRLSFNIYSRYVLYKDALCYTSGSRFMFVSVLCYSGSFWCYHILYNQYSKCIRVGSI